MTNAPRLTHIEQHLIEAACEAPHNCIDLSVLPEEYRNEIAQDLLEAKLAIELHCHDAREPVWRTTIAGDTVLAVTSLAYDAVGLPYLQDHPKPLSTSWAEAEAKHLEKCDADKNPPQG